MPLRFQQIKLSKAQRLKPDSRHGLSFHRWSQPEIDALTLALAAQRPLLVRGEPGTGKTQLARAAAVHLGWRLHVVVIHPRFEPQDLLARYDAVRRLADAQLGPQHLKPDAQYWERGALWQAFEPGGHVVLIDEIDKADSDLPNSLLEVLGQRGFRSPVDGAWIGGGGAAMPLVVITTNEERELPAAFVRRCVVLNLEPDPGQAYDAWLVARGEAHHGPGSGQSIDLEVMRMAARQLSIDRDKTREAGLPLPGPAEYLDLLAALHRLSPGDAAVQRGWLDRLSAYAYLKHGAVEGHDGLSQRRPATGGRDRQSDA